MANTWNDRQGCIWVFFGTSDHWTSLFKGKVVSFVYKGYLNGWKELRGYMSEDSLMKWYFGEDTTIVKATHDELLN